MLQKIPGAYLVVKYSGVIETWYYPYKYVLHINLRQRKYPPVHIEGV